MNNLSLKSYFDESSFLEDDLHHQQTLEGFEQLWQATEDSLPKDYRTPLEKLVDQQEEQILYLNDAVELLKNENFQLRSEMAEMQAIFEANRKVSEDYVNILELNRALTKQLNTVMSLREKEKNQIQALKLLLA